MSQRELGEMTGLSYAYISRIERGERTPSIKAIRKIAAALRVTAHYLETGDEHGLWVYVTKDELIDAANRGEDLARWLARENGVMVA